MNIVLFGPPGAGKGTQAKNLVNKLNSFQISTGDILRDEIKKDSDVGKRIINYMNEGKFVDDEIVNKIIKNIIYDPNKKNKLIFDGYPRTIEQAKNLDIWLNDTNQKINYIFFLNVNKETIIKSIPCPIINPISIAIEAIAIKPIWASKRIVKVIAPMVNGIKYSDNSNCNKIILDNSS